MPCLFPISFDLLVTVSHGGRTASSLVLRLSFFFFFFFLHVPTHILRNRSDLVVLVPLLEFVLPDGNGLVTKD